MKISCKLPDLLKNALRKELTLENGEISDAEMLLQGLNEGLFAIALKNADFGFSAVLKSTNQNLNKTAFKLFLSELDELSQLLTDLGLSFEDEEVNLVLNFNGVDIFLNQSYLATLEETILVYHPI